MSCQQYIIVVVCCFILLRLLTINSFINKLEVFMTFLLRQIGGDGRTGGRGVTLNAAC